MQLLSLRTRVRAPASVACCFFVCRFLLKYDMTPTRYVYFQVYAYTMCLLRLHGSPQLCLPCAGTGLRYIVVQTLGACLPFVTHVPCVLHDFLFKKKTDRLIQIWLVCKFRCVDVGSSSGKRLPFLFVCVSALRFFFFCVRYCCLSIYIDSLTTKSGVNLDPDQRLLYSDSQQLQILRHMCMLLVSYSATCCAHFFFS